MKPNVTTAQGTLAHPSHYMNESSLLASYQINVSCVISVFASSVLFVSSLKETGQEAQGDAEQHTPGDDSDGQLDGQELHRAGHQL